MRASAPTVGDYMTADPVTIGRAQLASRALDLMQQRSIRHLPVLHEGKLCGVVSHRELHVLEELELVHELVLVDAVMTRDPLVVTPTDTLKATIERMILLKVGSAVVEEGGKVVGILTTIDALRALADRL
jgi:acetoin utilization protein AcuB